MVLVLLISGLRCYLAHVLIRLQVIQVVVMILDDICKLGFDDFLPKLVVWLVYVVYKII